VKKVGKEVLFLAPGENNPRNGEDAFIRLKDGRILHVYTRFNGDDWHDEACADIAVQYSCDEGETWSRESILVRHTDYARSTMCPSLLRFANGDLGLIYLRKIDASLCSVVELIRSCDEGETWSEPVQIIPEQEYYVIENDHVRMLSDGRIILPLNLHSLPGFMGGIKQTTMHGKMLFAASDDDGATWYQLSDVYDLPYPEISQTGLQETILYEKKDGTLRAFSRTDLLCQYESVSTDRGATWTTPRPNTFFTSPTSPLNLKKIHTGALVAVFNPTPVYTARPECVGGGKDNWGRTPFVIALSFDDGDTYSKIYYIEDDLTNGYCYPSIFDGGDYLLIGYYHSNGTGIPLNSNKVVKIYYDELD